jgi:LacI family transcriptional regulator
VIETRQDYHVKYRESFTASDYCNRLLQSIPNESFYRRPPFPNVSSRAACILKASESDVRTPPQAVTLRDVARAAGVSTASASRALAGAGAVTTELRSRIVAAAARLRYVPNLAARTLATRRSGLIGFVVRDLADPLIANILIACERKLAESACGVMLTTTGGSSEEILLATQALLGRGTQALVFAEVEASAVIVRAMAARGVRWVSLTESALGAGVPSFSVGRRQGAVLAARYLQSLGHHRFAVIAEPDGEAAVAVQQLLTAASLPVEVLESGNDLNAAQAAMGRLLERDEPPTAVICGNDAQALAALRECALRNVAVPQRLSLIGFGDAEFARRSYPALSTVRVAAAEVGIRVAQAVVASLKGDEPLAPDVPVKLIARESTGPAFRSDRFEAAADVSRGTERGGST